MPYKHISFFLSTLFLWTGLAAQAQVTPSMITLGPSQTQQFSGPLGAQTTWAVEPVGLGGSITPTGLYTAPAVYGTGLAYVYALSGSGSTRAQVNLSRYAVITATSAPSTPAASISVSPSSLYLWAGQSKQFTASVRGISNQQVQWSIIQGVGSISNGLYTAPSSVSADSLVTISATSIANPTLTASATIMIGPAVASPAGTPTPVTVSVSLRPRSPSLSAGRSRQFNATVNGTSSTAVTWSLSPNVGAVVNGLYTAPTTISAPQSIEITATSTEDPTQSATSTINLALSPVAAPPPPPAPTSVSPAAATVAPSGTQQFSVQNLPLGTSVKWSINVMKGGITRSGLYTAPSSVATQQTITVTAMNASTQAVLGTASLTLQASPTLPLAPALTPTSVSPATVTLAPSGTQQFSVQNLPVGTSVTWSINVLKGGITQSGLYTAPSSVAKQQTITVTATNASTQAVLGTASLTLQASLALPSAPTLTPTAVSPSTVTVAPPGTQQFSVQNLPTGTTVAWVISPSTGSITQSGFYTAPSSVATLQTITVTATNASTAGVLGTATLTLRATPTTISVSPATATISPAGTQQFSVQNLPAGTSVTWSISVAKGSITQAGLYTAPSSLATQKTITVTATNSSTAAVLGTASLTVLASPSVSPATAIVAPSGSQQFSVQNLPAGTVVMWEISPSTGSIAQTGLYTAPGSVATQQAITVTAMNASTATVLGTASLTLQASAAAPTTTNILLPIEVMGTNATTVPVSFTLPSGSNLTGQLQLWLQIHGLEFQGQASVQVNNSAWLPINDTTATYLGQAKTFGGLGGGFSTLTLTMNLRSGSIQQGQNTLTFRFNGTDGNSSGFRVLNLNVLAANGGQLIPAGTFNQDDPSTWTAPLNDSTDIQAGQTLWQTANLTTPGVGPIQAKCGSCHAQDGRDLKYFNYSNLSIEARAVFHGLTAQQGAQIASYVRALDAPASTYARPWNPPYQPGPGMDSRAVTDWAAGAGLGAVLDQDSDMLQYLMPGGSTANWAAGAYLNQREIPIPIQLLDWNHWLPKIHPMDAWRSQFTTSSWYHLYLTVRSQLVPNNTVTDARVVGPNGQLQYWKPDENYFLTPLKTPESMNDPKFQANLYSTALWSVVKFWELEQEFGLEGMSQTFYGPQAPDRAWMYNIPFFTGPGVMGIPRPSPAVGNGLPVTHAYQSFAWYHLQLLLNEGIGAAYNNEIDWPYALGYSTNDLTWNAYATPTGPRVGTSGFLMEWLVKALQDDQLNDAQNPEQLVVFPGQVSWPIDISPSQKTQLINSYLTVWFAKFGAYTRAQFFALPMATPSNSDPTQMRFGADLTYALPQLRYQGADITLLNQIAAWAATIWPSYNWTGDLNGTCTAGNLGQVVCNGDLTP